MLMLKRVYRCDKVLYTMIPKILHQMWIGPKEAPHKMMTTWKVKNPDYEYVYWNESEIEKRGMKFVCMKQIDEIYEINGKCDIMRWEILHKYGGVFVDADSICMEALDDHFLDFFIYNHKHLY